MTPEATLKAAAAKLRETAAKATPGPWTAQEVPDEAYVEIMAGTEVAVAHAVCEHAATWGAAADADWIALMSPALAEPLAAGLELTAEHWRPERDLAKHYPARHAMQQEALTAARTILGEAP
jgi:hypothetical protein